MGRRGKRVTTQERYNQAWAWVAALAGDPATAVMDWRALHPTDKADPGHARRDTLPNMWSWLCEMNTNGFGIFAVVSAMDGHGRKLDNVQYIRAHFVDLDNAAAMVNLDRAMRADPPVSMVVRSSPIKAHGYWQVQPYIGIDRFQTLQRKLRQVYDSDPAVIDATRVMRVPGFFNTKKESAGHLVTVEAGPAWGNAITMEQLEQAYAAVQVIEGGEGVRHDLGDPDLAAPSLAWVEYALAQIDPNMLDRATWVSVLASAKQAAWTHATPEQVETMLMTWCARYLKNDPGENIKQIGSLRQTEVGWASLSHRAPGLRAQMAFGGQQVQLSPAPVPMAVAVPAPPAMDCSGEILTPQEQQEWFKGCVAVTKMGKVLGPDGRLHDQKSFNMLYGGKIFIVTTSGKSTDEPWKAATRSTMWTIPKVDHLRFLPHAAHGDIVSDELGRTGVNTYKPAMVRRVQGDPLPFLNHLALLIPDEGDRRILVEWMAHVVKYPGHKIPWAPVIQSTEGAGKGLFKRIMTHAMGKPYVHFPNAKELTASGSQFNGWMRNKLFILADEIKVDDKRDLIEVLKPLISEVWIEVQSKGVDQELEDCYAVWMFFTNYKDAVPIDKNGRRYCVFFSPLQTKQDRLDAGMDSDYYNRLYAWLDQDGAAIITDWLLNYPIERGQIPMDAPETTSHGEAVEISRSPVERCIMDAIAAGSPGFRGGWVSVVSAVNRLREKATTKGTVPPHVITSILTKMGYVSSGRSIRPYVQEDKDRLSDLYHFGGVGDITAFGQLQGWE